MGTNYPTEVERKFDTWKSTLTTGERNSIQSYTGSGYSGMNSYLRGTTTDSHYKEHIEYATKALMKAPKPPPPELVWRGTSSTDWAANLASGDVIEMKGLQSTSIKPEFAHSWAGGKGTLMEIKPSMGAYVKPLSSHPHEYEYLMPHGAKYRIVGKKTIKIYDRGAGRTFSRDVLQLEMLP